MFYKKFKAFKSSNLYSVLREEMADFKASHKFASSSEIVEMLKNYGEYSFKTCLLKFREKMNLIEAVEDSQWGL